MLNSILVNILPPPAKLSNNITNIVSYTLFLYKKVIQ